MNEDNNNKLNPEWLQKSEDLNKESTLDDKSPLNESEQGVEKELDLKDSIPVEEHSPREFSKYHIPPEIDEFRQKIKAVKEECKKLIVGQEEIVELMLTCIISGGHVLLEGVPGVAKTLIAKVLAKTIKCDFARIQFTPDLLPSDIIGTSVYKMNSSEFKFEKGPVFSNVVLIDEINRAPAKTQSALFEVMEEKQISFDGEQYDMSYPFFVVATQNPVEQEGTYRLPEAQLDRFLMKLKVGYPSVAEEVKILEKFKHGVGKPDVNILNHILKPKELKKLQKIISDVHVEEQLFNYICELVHETRSHGKIYLGASPRSSLAILRASKVVAAMMGRHYVIPDDIQYVAPHIMNHRIILSPDAEMESLTPESIIEEIIKEIEVPR